MKFFRVEFLECRASGLRGVVWDAMSSGLGFQVFRLQVSGFSVHGLPTPIPQLERQGVGVYMFFF